MSATDSKLAKGKRHLPSITPNLDKNGAILTENPGDLKLKSLVIVNLGKTRLGKVRK